LGKFALSVRLMKIKPSKTTLDRPVELR